MTGNPKESKRGRGVGGSGWGRDGGVVSRRRDKTPSLFLLLGQKGDEIFRTFYSLVFKEVDGLDTIEVYRLLQPEFT